jgi:hypothetical protein
LVYLGKDNHREVDRVLTKWRRGGAQWMGQSGDDSEE